MRLFYGGFLGWGHADFSPCIGEKAIEVYVVSNLLYTVLYEYCIFQAFFPMNWTSDIKTHFRCLHDCCTMMTTCIFLGSLGSLVSPSHAIDALSMPGRCCRIDTACCFDFPATSVFMYSWEESA